jgi:predicted lipid-binding transport protein (Tim44 family)
VVLESPSPSPAPAQTTAAKPAAKTSDSDRVGTLVQLLLAGAVLLGVGGGTGLYLTRSHR